MVFNWKLVAMCSGAWSTCTHSCSA